MRELLEKWTTLEPERCQGAYNFTVMTSVGWQQADRLPGILLSAVIEAVEARPAWEWTLWSDGRDREATVHVIEAAGIIRRNYSTGLTAAAPAEALLTAYLAALEAEGAA